MNTKDPFLLDVNNGQFSFHLTGEEALPELIPDDDRHYLLSNHKVKWVTVAEEDHNSKLYHIQIDGRTYKIQISDLVDQQILKMNLKSKKSSLFSELKAPMPGMVRQVLIKEGHTIVKGDALVILEAMKMENVLKSQVDGIVNEIGIKPGESVEKNQILLRFK